LIPSLTSPLEQLLASGGDTRLDIDPKTGRNRYECLPRPSEAVPFGSCTGSSVSQRGFAAAQDTQRLICSSRDSYAATYDCANNIRRRLRELLTLPDGVDVALAPSGTDVELLALALAAGREQRPVVNIVVGPGEVGSGTPQAAACCHYDRITPSGRQVVAGEPVDPALASLVDVPTVDLRAGNGGMLSESEIDAAVIELFVEASEADAIILLQNGRPRSESGVRGASAKNNRRRRRGGRRRAGPIQPPWAARRTAKGISRHVYGIEVLRRAAVFRCAVGAAEISSREPTTEQASGRIRSLFFGRGNAGVLAGNQAVAARGAKCWYDFEVVGGHRRDRGLLQRPE
jgi:hypothetical protein